MLGGIGVEFSLVLCDRLAELLLLLLPDVELLPTVWEHFETFRNVPVFAERSSSVHGVDSHDILLFEIVWAVLVPHLD